jgi:hypothetical protein
VWHIVNIKYNIEDTLLYMTNLFYIIYDTAVIRNSDV